jgi:parallel beta-helix repeat protein
MSAPSMSHRSMSRMIGGLRRLTVAGVAAGVVVTFPIAAGPASSAVAKPPPVAPDRATIKMRPSQFAVVDKPHQLAGTTRRHIVLRTDRVDLMVGPRVLWSGKLSAVGVRAGATVELPDVARLVARSPQPDWLTEESEGVWLLRAALAQAAGTHLSIAEPRVKELRMLTGKMVYLVGVSSKVSVTGVTVTSWRPEGGPDPKAGIARPFVSYDRKGAVIEATRSRFTHLGGNGTMAYGVSWGRGSTGSAIDSTFDHNYFGAYTNAAVGVVFRGNVFRENDLYGLDPHTNSRRLKIDRNESYRNGKHGIILSEHVVDSTITNNRTYENAANGIMMDDRSDNNVITGNRTWHNGGDGIVLQNSSGTTVRRNTVAGNRLGVRIGGASLSNTVTENQMINNQRGVEVYNGPPTQAAIAAGTTLSSNQLKGNDSHNGITVKDFAGVQITDNSVREFANAVVIRGTSRAAKISANRLSDNRRGIDIGATSAQAQLNGNVISDTTDRGIILSGPEAVSHNDSISGARLGMDVRNSAAVQDVSIEGGRKGMALTAGRTRVQGADISAENVGVAVDPGATLDLHSSEINAPQPVVGATASEGNILSRPPAPVQWLALAGAIFIAIAVSLHLLHRARSPICYAPTSSTPHGVGNA